MLNITKKRTKKGCKGLVKRIKTDAKKKKKKRRYGHEQYRNILADEKQRLIEYRNQILQKRFIRKDWLIFYFG